jgi:hypothetical protein
MSKLKLAAHQYISRGVCVIATNKHKIAFRPWKRYQDTLITANEVDELFDSPEAESLAIICGKSSGNLEVIDVDCKYDLTGTLWREYSQAIQDNDQELYDRLLIATTRSKGYHIYYRCETIAGNTKLARRHATDEELAKQPDEKIKVLIETRGQAGYVIAPPSAGYAVIRDAGGIPTITPAERDMLLELARSFNQVVEAPVKTYITTPGYSAKDYGLSPFEDYNQRGDIIGLLQTHGWQVLDRQSTSEKIVFRRPGKNEGTSGDYLVSKQWFSVFTTSSQFEPNKAYLPYAVYAVLECRGDFKEAARKLLAAGYGERREYYGDKVERELYRKKKEGMDKETLAKYAATNLGKSDDEAAEIVEKLSRIWGEKIATFWDVDNNGKVTINRTRLLNFLHHTGGFYLYYYDKTSTIFRIVQCRDGFVEEVSTEHMKKFLKEYIESLPDSFDGGVTSEDLSELILKGADTYFTKSLLEFLTRSHFDFLRDSESEAFFPFLNGVVRVDKNGAALLSYAEIKKVIWKSQVIDHEIIIDAAGIGNAEYGSFLNLISGGNEIPADEPNPRFRYACTLIGYLLHKYKDFSRPYAVILAEETDNENEGGGTGKGIFITALSHFMSTQRIDGKNFKLDKNFAFQRVGLDTKLVAIEDCRKNVDFEGFYSIITEGMTVEKKNKDELFIAYKDSPKIMFTTNYTISSTGNHAKRRQRVFEFANFFNASNTPASYFGHNLFDGWDKDEWNRFFNLGFYCVESYLEMGIVTVETTIKLKRKYIKGKYGEMFLDWFDTYAEYGRKKWQPATELYHGFLKEAELEKREFPQQKFGRGLSEAVEIISFPEPIKSFPKLEKRIDKASGNRKVMRIVADWETISENGEDRETIFGNN